MVPLSLGFLHLQSLLLNDSLPVPVPVPIQTVLKLAPQIIGRNANASVTVCIALVTTLLRTTHFC